MQFDVPEPPEVNAKLVGTHVADRPLDGVTVHDSVSEPTNPLRLVSVAVEAPDEPAGKVTVDGPAVTLKSGGVITVTLIVAEWERKPAVPVTVAL